MISAFPSYKPKAVDLQRRSLYLLVSLFIYYFTCLNIYSFIEVAAEDEKKHALDVARYCAQQTNLWTVLMRRCLFLFIY